MNGWIKAWAVGLVLAGWAYAGEPPPFRETARLTLDHRLVVEEAEPMAVYLVNRWLGFNGDWDNTSNWSQGALPGADDVVLFDGTSSTSVTTNLDTAVIFKHLYVTPGYGGNHGSQGSPLTFPLATGVAVWRGSGKAYWDPKDGNTAHVVCDVKSGVGSQPNLVIGGSGIAAASAIRHLAVKRGYVNLMGDTVVGLNIYTVGDAARLVIDANLNPGVLNDPAHVFCVAGEIINRRATRAAGVLVCGDRGRLTQIGKINTTTQVLVSGNGKFKYLPTTAPGNSPPISFLGGLYDETGLIVDHTWGMTVISPDMAVIGGTIRNTGSEVASLDLRMEYPGEQE